jgi:lysozyme family protein
MANWKVSFDWMMDSEDPARAYAVVPDAPPGAFAVSGINSAAFPGEFEAIAALAQNERALAVEQFYERNFWNQWFAQIDSDEVAKRVFDMAVNGGAGTSTRLLQQAVNSFHVGNPLETDGEWGPATVAAVNAVNPLTLVAAFQQARCAYYECIVAKNPADAKYLAGWLARAKR